MPKNPKIESLQREIADKQSALRAILEAEHKAAQALVAETEEALAVLGGKVVRAPRVRAEVKPVMGRPPLVDGGEKLASARAMLAKHGRLTARQLAALLGIKNGHASSFLLRLKDRGEARVAGLVISDSLAGPRRVSSFELVGKGA